MPQTRRWRLCCQHTLHTQALSSSGINKLNEHVVMTFTLQPGPGCRGNRECIGPDSDHHLKVHEILHQPVPSQPELGRSPCSNSVLSKCHDRDVHEDGKFLF